MNRRAFLKGSVVASLGVISPWRGRSMAAEASGGDFDVVVYGASSGGIVAAVQAAQQGNSVVLVEPSSHLGGLTTGGLGRTDSGKKESIGGLSREFYRRVYTYYTDGGRWTHESREAYIDRTGGMIDTEDGSQWGFEPHVARRIYEIMLEDAKVPVVMEDRLILDRARGVQREGDRIAAIVTEAGNVYRGRIFIDATYEGDLVAMAGLSYRVGRESNEEYGEKLNGVQKARSHNHVFIVDVDPYVRPGDPDSGLLPNIHDGNPGADGEGDHRVQAYCYRMCLTDAPDIRVPFEKPEGYNELEYELFFRNFEAGDTRMPWLPGHMPNRKTDTNNRWAFSTNYVGMNYEYPDGGYAKRRQILDAHEHYQRGLMWTMAYHPRTPAWIREEVSAWGLAGDEFTNNRNWPPQIYVREARRMVGEYVTTESDCRRLRVAEDSVGLGSYNMDSHSVQRYVTHDGLAQNEGNLEYPPGGPYAISYRSLIPKKDECTNLYACCNAVSASHIAFGSVRMEPVFMILGQSAAIAAGMAIEAGTAVHDVPYGELRKKLLTAGQVLDVDLEKWPPSPLEA